MTWKEENTQIVDAELTMASGVKGKLVVMSGASRGKTFVITKDKVLVGGSDSCDLVLEDATVSRKHFKIERRKKGYSVIDLKSTNGTIVNGIRVKDASLKTNSIITAGSTLIQFVLIEEKEVK